MNALASLSFFISLAIFVIGIIIYLVARADPPNFSLARTGMALFAASAFTALIGYCSVITSDARIEPESANDERGDKSQ